MEALNDANVCKTAQETENFEMVEINEMKILPKPIGYERRRASTSGQKSHTDSSGPSSARYTESSTIETPLTDLKSWTPWSDDRIEKAVAQVFNFKQTEPTSTDSSIFEACDNIPTTVILPRSDIIRSKTDTTGTSQTTSTTVAQQQIHQLSAVAFSSSTSADPTASSRSVDPTIAETTKSTLNGKKFVWNPDAPSFIPHRLINSQKIKPHNYCSILNGIRTSDAPLPFLSPPVGAPLQIRHLTPSDQLTLSVQSFSSIAHPTLTQNLSFADGTTMSVYCNKPITQTTPTAAAAGRITAMSGYGTSIPTHYKTTVVQTTPYHSATTVIGASGSIRQMSGYGVVMSDWNETNQIPFVAYNQPGFGMVYSQHPIVHVVPSTARAQFSSVHQTHAQISMWSLWNEWYNWSTSRLLYNMNGYLHYQA